MWTLYSQCVCNAFRPDNREDKRLLSACLCLFVSNKLSSFEGFSFMASWLGVLGNAVCYWGPYATGRLRADDGKIVWCDQRDSLYRMV